VRPFSAVTFNELLSGFDDGRPGGMGPLLDLVLMVDGHRVALVIIDSKTVSDPPRRSILEMRKSMPVASSPETTEGQMLLPPAQSTPRPGVELVDRQRRPVVCAGRRQRGHGDRRQVWGCSQNVQGGLPDGAQVKAGSAEQGDGFGFGLVDHGQEEMLRADRFASLGCELGGSLLGLHHQIAGPAPVNPWRIGRAGD
jgi:hypothetical protein